MNLRASIAAWSMPNGIDFTLSVTVAVQPFGPAWAYYRCKENKRDSRGIDITEWSWRRWSMADKPTVKVGAECATALDELVHAHPDLSKLVHLLGLVDAAEAEA